MIAGQMAEHEGVQPAQAPAAPVVMPAAPTVGAAPASGLGMGPPASFEQWDPGPRARYASGLRAGHGTRHVARMATLARTPPVELNPGNLEVPTEIGQEYAVDAEVEEMCARVVRGELSAAEAEAQLAQSAAARAAAAEGAAGAQGAAGAIGQVARALA